MSDPSTDSVARIAERWPPCRRARCRFMISSVAPVIAVLVVAALAVFSAERRIAWLHVPSKPLTTALLFFAVIGRPETTLRLLGRPPGSRCR